MCINIYVNVLNICLQMCIIVLYIYAFICMYIYTHVTYGYVNV